MESKTMIDPLDIMSDIIIHMKYSKYNFEKERKENWEEIVYRNMEMHIKKFPLAKPIIEQAYKLVFDKKVFPSMRSLQFGGEAINRNNVKMFNCSYLPVDSRESFSEIFYILLCGTGVGYSVQNHHINKLPKIKKPLDKSQTNKFVIEDSIEGWADSILALLICYTENKEVIETINAEKLSLEIAEGDMKNKEKFTEKIKFDSIKPMIEFDYSKIRPKGSLISSSTAKAPGPDGLKKTHEKLIKILESKNDGDKLSSLECHDIICHISDCVLSGGIRRASLISFFDADDIEMMNCKTGDWYIDNIQRSNANNSVVLYKPELKREDFDNFFDITEKSGSGDPGLFFTNDKNKNICSNPCAEISLNPYQMCNLCEISAKDILSKEDFIERVKAATLIGTLQASYTNFHYLRPVWKETTDREALLGIGITGLANGNIEDDWLEEGANIAREYNLWISKHIGINSAARITCVKPSGTVSLVAGVSSGVHPWYAPYYIRRITVNSEEPIYKYLKNNHPELIETVEYKNSEGEVTSIKHTINIPIKAPDGAICRKDETEIEFLERIKKLNLKWINPGHVKGVNKHNVSCTVPVKNDNWGLVKEWMWENKDYYSAIALLPYYEEDNTYQQLPHEEISREKYLSMVNFLKKIDLDSIKEFEYRNFESEPSCSAGSCEIL